MNKKTALIAWNDALTTGVTTMDEQHKILVNMINEANDLLNETTGRDVYMEVVKDLIAYALYHFDDEEELMIAAQYPQEAREKHIEEHRAFSHKVTTIHQELVHGKLIDRNELIGYLNHWLVNHIMGTDQQLGKALLAKEKEETSNR
jgi:hemerythrin-like metal-binding protein